MTTTLLAKDTAHRTVYPVFTPGGGFAMEEMQGGGDFIMVADPSTFRILPWANKTGWILCDIYFGNGKAVAVLHALRGAAMRSIRSQKRASIFSPDLKSNSICSSWKIRG
jgi:glutamine synthetase